MMQATCPYCDGKGMVHVNSAQRVSLTRVQRATLDYISGFIQQHGYSPSYEEMAAHFGVRSMATIHERLDGLIRKGWITRRPREARSIELVA